MANNGYEMKRHMEKKDRREGRPRETRSLNRAAMCPLHNFPGSVFPLCENEISLPLNEQSAC